MSKNRSHRKQKPLKSHNMKDPRHYQQTTDDMIKRLNKDLGISKNSSQEPNKKDR